MKTPTPQPSAARPAAPATFADLEKLPVKELVGIIARLTARVEWSLSQENVTRIVMADYRQRIEALTAERDELNARLEALDDASLPDEWGDWLSDVEAEEYAAEAERFAWPFGSPARRELALVVLADYAEDHDGQMPDAHEIPAPGR